MDTHTRDNYSNPGCVHARRGLIIYIYINQHVDAIDLTSDLLHSKLSYLQIFAFNTIIIGLY